MAGEWREVALEDVADELTVGYVGPMASEYVSDGIPFLRSLNVERLRINQNDLKFITPDFHQRIQKSKLQPGDVVIVRTGKPGTCSVVPDWLEEANCSDLVIVRCGTEINQHFLAYYVNSAAAGHIAAHLVGAVQQHFNVGSAKALRIKLPPLHEQCAIAHILGTLDDKIELNRRRSQTLEAMARALFQDWFVDFGPVRAKMEGREPYLPADLWQLFPERLDDQGKPEGWETQSVYEFSKVIYGAAFSSARFNSKGIGRPLIRIRDLNTHEPGVYTDEKHPKGHLIEAGDIVVGMDGEFRLHIWKGEPAWLNQRVCHFEPLEGVPTSFLVEALKEPLSFFERGKVGTTVIHLGKSDIDTFKLIHPGASLLGAFGKATNALVAQAVRAALESRALAQLRNTLLPKLVSGELRIESAERFLETAV